MNLVAIVMGFSQHVRGARRWLRAQIRSLPCSLRPFGHGVPGGGGYPPAASAARSASNNNPIRIRIRGQLWPQPRMLACASSAITPISNKTAGPRNLRIMM